MKWKNMKTPTSFSRGQLFIRENKQTGNDDLYVLAMTGVDEHGESLVNLINIITGERWTTAVAVKNGTEVTLEEMDKIYSSGTFKPVEFANDTILVKYQVYHTVSVATHDNHLSF
jgi:hypothetical protein